MRVERGAEAGEVRAALVRVDVVRERVHRLGVGAVPLHRDLDVALLARAGEGDDVRVRGVLRRVDVAHVVGDAALVAERLVTLAAALVDQLEAEAGGQERHLAHARGEHVELELAILEDLEVGQEADGRAGALGVRERRDPRSARSSDRRARTTACTRAPLRWIVRLSYSLSAFTTETPTPCRPPDTL